MTSAVAELDESYLEWERRQSGWAFSRIETRHSSRSRTLDCNHRIDPAEPYVYFVGKPNGDRKAGLVQRRTCDVCKRADDRY